MRVEKVVRGATLTLGSEYSSFSLYAENEGTLEPGEDAAVQGGHLTLSLCQQLLTDMAAAARADERIQSIIDGAGMKLEIAASRRRQAQVAAEVAAHGPSAAPATPTTTPPGLQPPPRPPSPAGRSS